MKLTTMGTFLFGLLVLIIVLSGLITGEIPSLGAGGNSSMIEVSEQPFHYWLSIIFGTYFGGLFVWSSFQKKDDQTKNSSNIGPFDIKLNKSSKKNDDD